MEVTYEIANAFFEYQNGVLMWRKRDKSYFDAKNPERAAKSWNTRHAGNKITHKDKDGYIIAKIFTNNFKVHRIVWLLHNKTWPNTQIDHINGIKCDNRIENLREVTNAENQRNLSLKSTNNSGYAGIRWRKEICKWHVDIGFEGKSIYLGCYADLELAIFVRFEAEDKYGYSRNLRGDT